MAGLKAQGGMWAHSTLCDIILHCLGLIKGGRVHRMLSEQSGYGELRCTYLHIIRAVHIFPFTIRAVHNFA